MKVRGIDFTVYLVSDMERSVKFYTDLIGMEPESNWDNQYVEYIVDGAAFGLYAGGAKPGGGQVAFNVANLAEALAELRAKGVKVVMETEDTPVCRMAAIADPDGNSVILHEKPKVA